MNTRSSKPPSHAVVEPPRHRAAGERGFALVITLSLLILLMVIAVGFLSLSSISLRSSNQSQAQMQARANARLALQFAIAELQKQAGPDTRVTAPADILDDSGSSPSNLAVTGVWKSWEGGDHTASGEAAARPIAPYYDSKRQPASSSTGRFLSWLVSKPETVYDEDLISEDPAWSVSTALQDIVGNTPFKNSKKEDSVPLVSTGSLAAGDAREVHVIPVPIDGGASQRGSYAWWVSGENQKARLPVPYKPANNDDAAAWSVQAKSHATADPSALDLDPVLAADGPAKAAKALSLGMSTLLVNDPLKPNPAKQFHDLSAVSVGLLTNTATGGWRKDLSLFTENWDLLPASGVEVFRLTPTTTATMTKPQRTEVYGDITPAGSLFYPWSRHRVPPSADQIRQSAWSAAVTSWHHLKDFATLYKQIDASSGKPVMASRLTWGRYDARVTDDMVWTGTLTGTTGITAKQAMFDYLHKARVIPVWARTHIVYFLRSVPITSGVDAGKYKVQIGFTPLTTLWNPYNLTLKSSPQWLSLPRNLPPAFRFDIGSQSTDYHYYRFGGSVAYDNDTFKETDGSKPRANWVKNTALGSIDFNMHRDPASALNPLYSLSMKPGVTKVFSTSTVGYNPAVSPIGFFDVARWDPVLKINVPLAFNAADTIRMDARFDTGINGLDDAGAYTDFGTPMRNAQQFGNPKALSTRITYTRAVANALWPPIPQDQLPTFTVSELYDTTNARPVPKPFLSMMFGSRLSTDTNVPVKGALQSDPLLSHLQMGAYGLREVEGQKIYGSTRGINSSVNAGFDFSFVPHSNGGVDSRMPNVSTDGENRGYIVTGVQSGDGLSRIATVELPLRPLGSLAELQHWGLRVDTILPPYQSFIIANSDAQPVFAPDAVFGTNTNATTNIANNLQHDDSYCANHLLFDDWFFSTIAPQPTTYGPTGKTLQQTFTDFVRTGAPLDNRAYQPILEDRGISAADATTLYNTKVNASDSYRSIASRLEVDGMFNVNSTSVKAWRALLGHARNQRVPFYNNAGDIVLSDPTEYATPRTTVASDVAAGKNGSSGTFVGASEYSGYRVFTDGMLDQMAEEMVKQVRKRGPFLSLSEFVNRQLSNNPSDNSLALAGAVQSALNVLAANANAGSNPYSALQADSLSAGWSVLYNPDPTKDKSGGSDFTYFPAASEGKSAYGLPGWPRQADILRPLAPILTARDDTFTIRAYGDARDANGKVTARATCEAVVRRDRGFVSPGQDAPDITGPPTAAPNQQFGRKFQLVSFRWLHPDEI